jgi:hypothetical protein
MCRLYRSSENTNQRVSFDIEPSGRYLGTGGQVHVLYLLMLNIFAIFIYIFVLSIKLGNANRMAWPTYMIFKVVNGSQAFKLQLVIFYIFLEITSNILQAFRINTQNLSYSDILHPSCLDCCD